MSGFFACRNDKVFDFQKAYFLLSDGFSTLNLKHQYDLKG